jgi:hypothetical protein
VNLTRIDRALQIAVPIMVALVLTVSLILLGFTHRQLQDITERAEQRTERLVDLLLEGRDQWGPALDRIEDLTVRLCAADPDCDL